jgi:hypothetical protein
VNPDGLTARIVGLHGALERAGLPHAFGGALALAFCTEEPRATKDIDVNVFVGVGRLDAVLAALPQEVRITDAARLQLERDGQARLWWGDTPVDVFLSNHPFHGVAEANRRAVPFAGVPDLPVLACADLAVFKAFFARPKDVVDLATMGVAGTVDLDELERTVTRLLASAEDRAELFRRVRDTAAQLRAER